jgi:hypothetical protein
MTPWDRPKSLTLHSGLKMPSVVRRNVLEPGIEEQLFRLGLPLIGILQARERRPGSLQTRP